MLSRTAWLAFLASAANAAILFIIAVFFRIGSTQSLTCQALAFSVAFVGLLWSARLDVRALRNGEPRPPLITLLATIEIIPFIYGLTLWYGSNIFGWQSEYFLPVLLPFPLIATLAALLALKLFGRFVTRPKARMTLAAFAVLAAFSIFVPAPLFLLSLQSDSFLQNAIADCTPNVIRDAVENRLHVDRWVYLNRWQHTEIMLLKTARASDARLLERTADPDNFVALAALRGLAKRRPDLLAQPAYNLYKRVFNPRSSFRVSWNANLDLLPDIVRSQATLDQQFEFARLILEDASIDHYDFLARMTNLPRRDSWVPLLERLLKDNDKDKITALALLFNWLPDEQFVVVCNSILAGKDSELIENVCAWGATRPLIFCAIMRRNDKVQCRAALNKFAYPGDEIRRKSPSMREAAEWLLKKLDDADIVQRRGAYHGAQRLRYATERDFVSPPELVNFAWAPGIGLDAQGNPLPPPETPEESKAFQLEKQRLQFWLNKNQEPGTK